MATVQPTQVRVARAATTCAPPPSSGHMYSRPWRSSPLAGPVFSTLPPIISESSEEDLAAHEGPREFRSPPSLSIVSQASTAASGYASSPGSALVDGEGSITPVSPPPSTSAHGTGSQSHAHSQTHSTHRPARLTKRRRPHAKNVSEVSITPPPRARTAARDSRPASHLGHSVDQSPTVPSAFHSEFNIAKQSPSISRAPASDWMSSTPFGPAMTPKFSRLAMASPTVVMPLSAREYRKQKAREAHEKGREKDAPTSASAFRSPPVNASSPPSEDVHQSRSPLSPFGGHNIDLQFPPRPQVNHSPTKPLSHASLSVEPQGLPSQPRSSPLVLHPPITPKSSAGSFFSLASTPDDTTTPSLSFPAFSQDADDPILTNAVPLPRPRPRRRKSHPDRLSNGTRLSLLEAVNRLSQESAAFHRLSGDVENRLSVVSQASGRTIFYDANVEEESGNETENNAGGLYTSVLHTQSLEDLSLSDERKGKRNVRVVRISDTVEVSSPPVYRPRKLTKSRPGLAHATGVKDMQTQPQPRSLLLPWKSKGSGDGKGGLVSAAADSAGAGEKSEGVVRTHEATAPASVPLPAPTIEAHSNLKSNGTPTKKTSSDTPTPTPTPVPIESSSSMPPRKARRYTFSFFSSTTFPRPKRETAHPSSVELFLACNTKTEPSGSARGVESGTDSPSTSVRTITQGGENTLTPTSSVVYDLTTLASSGGLPGARRGAGAATAVPMLRRLNAQEMEMANAGELSQSDWDARGGSTPSLITNASTATTSSSPRTPSFVRASGGGGSEPSVPRPSGLKESCTDTSEEDSEGGGRTSQMYHRKLDQNPLARAVASGGETSGEDERMHVCASPGLLSPSPRRPGTSSSTLTTATSGSYASCSTVAASTNSSRSTSPSLVMLEKRDRVVVLQGGDEDEDLHACAMCGHVISRSTSPSLPHDAEQAAMHPMFTVPLVTVPASAVPYSRSTHSGRLAGSGAGQRGERQLRLSVPVAAVGSQAKNDRSHNHVYGPVTRTVGSADKIVSPLPTLRKRRRPQTVPVGMGDAFKLIEERDGADKPMGESRVKAVLKGLLRRNE